ncbi:MAG: YIP1 family protein [Bryobacterales bacterium]|nr:YIP1 family protein [Bryobacterales bacterium]
MTESPASPSAMSEIGRLTGIFWEPKPVFQDLAARPRFWAPLILLTALSLVYIISFSRLVGWESMIRRQMDRNPRIQQLTPEQRERAVQQGLTLAAPLGYAGAAVGMTVASLVVAGVLLGAMNLLGGAGLKYRQAFSITVYSFLPSALASILALLVMFLKNPEDFDLQNPLPLNIGAFLSPAGTAAWLRAIGRSLDLFGLWIILLMALGFSTAAGKRLSFGKALVLVVVPWAVYVLAQASLAGLSVG